MTLKSDAKFQEKPTFGLKNNKNLVNFHASSVKSENLCFDVLLLSIAYKFQLKKYRIIPHGTEKCPNLEE